MKTSKQSTSTPSDIHSIKSSTNSLFQEISELSQETVRGGLRSDDGLGDDLIWEIEDDVVR